ncbi:hypothetical protein [uncultured Roseobacter sp.]|uniref:hypothetical protein n=1 Tax=uncultured Roseobacter sp. TaxID=114847 RepID=UPI002626FA70|nr:hypothetical protein [uncultured Roseobacter sp.]
MPKWLNGCLSLASSESDTMKPEMELHCASRAFDYCEIGRLEQERYVCMSELAAHLEAEIEERLPLLTSYTSLTGFKKMRYERGIAKLKNGDLPSCQHSWNTTECRAFQAVGRWLDVRGLSRLAGLPVGGLEVPDDE